MIHKLGQAGNIAVGGVSVKNPFLRRFAQAADGCLQMTQCLLFIGGLLYLFHQGSQGGANRAVADAAFFVLTLSFKGGSVGGHKVRVIYRIA